jgi:hypothetical protein
MSTGWLGLAFALTFAAPMALAQDHASDKPDFSGTWAIDRTLSADLAKINLGTTTENDQQRGRQGGFGGFGRRGGYGGRTQSTNRNAPGTLTDVETSRLKAISTEIRTAFDRLVISHHDPSLVVNDAKDRTQFFRTTGEMDENHLGDVTVSSTTRWEGPRIVTTYGLSTRLKVVTTYTVLAKTKQLIVRFAMQDTENRRGGEPEIKLVYTPGL